MRFSACLVDGRIRDLRNGGGLRLSTARRLPFLALRSGIRSRCLLLALGVPCAALAPPPVHAGFCPVQGTVISTTDIAQGDAPLAVRCCDLNGDGFPDLVTANDGSDTLSVLLNNGDGTYAPKVRWPVDTDPEGVSEPVDLVCCDLNGDSLIDLITVNHTSDDVSVLLHTGNMQFAAPVKYAVGEAPFGIECLDLDGIDGPDLITNGFTADAISVLLNLGDGTFAPHVTYPTGDAPIAMAVCDVDGDANLDVVTANMLGKNVSVLRNNADGTFTNVGTAPLCSTPQTCVNPFDIVCCDLDGVNGPDVATANGIADTVTLLFNDGNGNFAGYTSYGLVDGAYALACCDVDGDAHLDIISANLTSDDLAVFLNDGLGVLAAPLSLPLGAGSTADPSAVVCCNVDNDPDQDLVTTFVDGLLLIENDCSATCGNGNLDDGEECDDGNNLSGDGCSSDCQLEPLAVPTASEWGVAILALLTMTTGTAILRYPNREPTRKRRPIPTPAETVIRSPSPRRSFR